MSFLFFHFSPIVFLAFLFVFLREEGRRAALCALRSVATQINQSFRFYKVDVATLEVAKMFCHKR